MTDRRVCPRCGTTYEADLGPKRAEHDGTCWTLLCQAITWDAERWEGAARMAVARKEAEVPLNAIDIEALTRTRKAR